MKISEIEVIPVKPHNGLVAFASCVIEDSIYLGSIGLYTRLEGGYRLSYPTKFIGNKSLNIYHPINKNFADAVEQAVVKKFEEVMEGSHDGRGI
jgi:DNA-binding cell septation regulator SpoVG